MGNRSTTWEEVEDYARNNGCHGTHQDILLKKAKAYNDAAGYNGNVLVIDEGATFGYRRSPGMGQKKLYRDDNVMVAVGLDPGYIQFTKRRYRWAGHHVDKEIWRNRRAIKIGDGGPEPDVISVAFASEIENAWTKVMEYANNTEYTALIRDKTKEYARISGTDGPILVINTTGNSSGYKWSATARARKSYSGSMASVYIGISPGFVQFKGPVMRWSGDGVDSKVWEDRRAIQIGDGQQVPEPLTVAFKKELQEIWTEISQIVDSFESQESDDPMKTMETVHRKATEYAEIKGVSGPILIFCQLTPSNNLWHDGCTDDIGHETGKMTVRIGVSAGYVQFKYGDYTAFKSKGIDTELWKERRAIKIGDGGSDPTEPVVAFKDELDVVWTEITELVDGFGLKQSEELKENEDWKQNEDPMETMRSIHDKAVEYAEIHGAVSGPILVFALSKSVPSHLEWSDGCIASITYKANHIELHIGLSPGFLQFKVDDFKHYGSEGIDAEIWKDRRAIKIGECDVDPPLLRLDDADDMIEIDIAPRLRQTEEKPDLKTHSICWLLICGGKTGEHGIKRYFLRSSGREKAKATNSKDDDDSKDNAEPRHLWIDGIDRDARTAVRCILDLNGQIGCDARGHSVCQLKSYICVQSVSLGQNVSPDDLQMRIEKWLQEDADEHVLYFSGEGTGSGIGVYGGIYLYDQLAKTVNLATGSKSRDRKSTSVTIVLDTCFSGAVYDAFKPYQQSKFNRQCVNDKGALFHVFFSSQKNQRSIEFEDGGIFTADQLGPHTHLKWARYFVNKVRETDEWVTTYKVEDSDIVQVSGSFDYRPGPHSKAATGQTLAASSPTFINTVDPGRVKVCFCY